MIYSTNLANWGLPGLLKYRFQLIKMKENFNLGSLAALATFGGLEGWGSWLRYWAVQNMASCHPRRMSCGTALLYWALGPKASGGVPHLQLGVQPGDPRPPLGQSSKINLSACYSQRSPRRRR